MKRVNVRHHQAIWETTSFTVEVPDEYGDDVDGYIRENFDCLMVEAFNNDRADIAAGDAVEGMDTEIEVVPAQAWER